MQPEPSSALVLAAFTTIGLPEHQGLRANKPCRRDRTKNTPRLQTLKTQNHVNVAVRVSLYMQLPASNDLQQLCEGPRKADTRKFLFVARQPHRIYSKQGRGGFVCLCVPVRF